MTAPLVIDDFLEPEAYKRLRAYVLAQPMTYGSKSNSRTDPHGHWSWKPVHDQRQNLADLTETLPEELRGPWERIAARMPITDGPKDFVKLWKGQALSAVIRCYANGYTYGTDGYFHTDSTRADEHTVILYMCETWDSDWAGETVWRCDDLAGGWASVMPAPNRAVILPSNRLHCARAVSRKCTELRVTLMYKVRPRRSAEFEKLSQWLVAHGALKQSHSEGTLHDHLVRVFALLEARKLPLAVCHAGGLHSIYGTNHYPRQLLAPTADIRSMVSSAFGYEAESLAYMFSVLDRPKTLGFDVIQAGPRDVYSLKLRYDQSMNVLPSMLHTLQLIEAANLADQNSLHNWPNLKHLWESP